MNKLSRFIFITTLLTVPYLKAAEEGSDVDFSNIGPDYESLETPAQGPFKLQFDGDAIGKSRFKKSRLHGQRIGYNEWDAEAGFIFYHDPIHNEAANVELTYSDTGILWKENPYFNQDHFKTLSISLGYFSKRIDYWLWSAQVAINLDTDHWDVANYGTYNFLLWGRYDYCFNPDIRVHVGFLAETGLQIDHVYPIIGFDWQIVEDWKLNLVFPVNMSLVYSVDRHWSLALGARIFNSRFRAGENQPLPEAIVQYRNSGIELAVNYEYEPWFDANIHVGSTLGGRLKISNRHYKHGHTFDFDDAVYAGGEAIIKF